ncbi:uncharacterized protein LOC143193524 [Rhynchophorus ferrugineus]|uniref:uncharacterized protein LOC143193524 n=1 Tax=Rhynchophorus ferrugineus TaxID=354439 RepID=UPI003FCED109
MAQSLLDEKDCKIIISKYLQSEKFEFVTFRVKPFVDKEREYYRDNAIIEISVKISKNISRLRLFLKQYHSKYPALVTVLRERKMSEREIFFYEIALPEMIKGAPDYDADFVPSYFLGKLNRFVILEDLSASKFVVAKKYNYLVLDRFHVSLGLKALSKLHALSLATLGQRETLTQNSLLQDNPLKCDSTLPASIKGLKTLLVAFNQSRGAPKDDLNERLDVFIKNCTDLMDAQREYRQVLCHGNIYTRNLLFKYEGSLPVDCKLLNFELIKYFPPAYDVLMFIYFTTVKTFRQHYFTHLIKYYYDCLTEELRKLNLDINKELPVKEFERSIDTLMPVIKLSSCVFLQNFGAKKGFYEGVKKDSDLYKDFLFNDKSQIIEGIMKKDPIFKEIIIESLEELMEIITVSKINKEVCYKLIEETLGTTLYELENYQFSSDNSELTVEVKLDDEKDSLKSFTFIIDDNKNKYISELK